MTRTTSGNTLRHLVQVRDGQCTFPACTRHARDGPHAVAEASLSPEDHTALAR